MLFRSMQAAMSANDWKLVSQVSRKIDQIQKTAEKAELEAKRAELEAMQSEVGDAIMAAVEPMITSGQLDKADGIWFSYDFGEQKPTVRLMKTATRAARTGGGGTGKKFDVSTDDMLARHGNEAYKNTEQTFKAAYDSNTDKNWRYGIRNALLKLEGII